MLDASPAPITEPGLYAVSAERYHSAALCDGPSLSSTALRTIINDGLEAYWARSPYNLDALTPPNRDAFRLGEAAHVALLEPHLLAERVAVSPYDDYRMKDARAWRADAAAAGRLILTRAELEQLKAMRAALDRSPRVRNALTAGRAEQSLVWRDEETGLWLKARPDFLPNDRARLIVDYKTAASVGDDWATKAALDYRYDIQAWLQIEGVRKVLGIEPRGVLYIVQEKTAPYRVKLRLIDCQDPVSGRLSSRDLLRIAEADARAALRDFRRCYDSGDWSDGDDLMTIADALPDWARARIEKRVTDYGE